MEYFNWTFFGKIKINNNNNNKTTGNGSSKEKVSQEWNRAI